MRIALVVHDYHRLGGHSRYCAELAERFAREHEVHVFANRFPLGVPLFPESAHETGRLYLHPVYAQRSTALGTVLSFFVPATRAIRLHGPFDIVHAQGFVCGHYDVLTAHICCAAWSAQRKVSGHDYGFKERLFDAAVTRLERWLYPRYPAAPVIAISRRVQADLARFCGRHTNVTVIPHGVDTGEFDISRRARWRGETRAELGWSDAQFTALWVGDLRKGAQAAMEAVARNPGQHFASVARNNPEPFRELARRLGLEGRCHLLPPTNEIARYYAAADVFLFPTTYDAFGMVVLEAMAMGLPAIVSKDAGAAELIEHEVSGLLLDRPTDTGQSAAWLRRLEENGEWRQGIAEQALALARAQSWDGVAEQTLSLYQKYLEDKV
jgi:UDP-glucose:(heptosyl)LPS alpha-1,3-glucosyltransferase